MTRKKYTTKKSLCAVLCSALSFYFAGRRQTAEPDTDAMRVEFFDRLSSSEFENADWACLVTQSIRDLAKEPPERLLALFDSYREYYSMRDLLSSEKISQWILREQKQKYSYFSAAFRTEKEGAAYIRKVLPFEIFWNQCSIAVIDLSTPQGEKTAACFPVTTLPCFFFVSDGKLLGPGKQTGCERVPFNVCDGRDKIRLFRLISLRIKKHAARAKKCIAYFLETGGGLFFEFDRALFLHACSTAREVLRRIRCSSSAAD